MTAPTQLGLSIQPQPDDSTCGPTCLHAVYRFFGETDALGEVISSTPTLPGDGSLGTLAVMLGCHSLRRGYAARLLTFNLGMFDPSWFPDPENKPASSHSLREKLQAQCAAKGPANPKLAIATNWYLEFLELGGRIWMPDLTSSLLASHLAQGLPILTGLSATYLYRCARETIKDYDDINGDPAGHFVIVDGYDPTTRMATVADPLADNPAFGTQHYEVPMSRLVGAIMLGVLTFDANILIIQPVRTAGGHRTAGDSA